MLPKKSKKYFRELGSQGILEVLEWTAQSPELNPIENSWVCFDFVIGQRCVTDVGAMMKILNDASKQISKDGSLLQTLIESMSHRIEAVLEENGGPTKY